MLSMQKDGNLNEVEGGVSKMVTSLPSSVARGR